MSLSAVRKCLPLSRILSNSKVVLPNTSKSFLVNSRTITRSLFSLCKNQESSYLRQFPLSKTCTCAVHTDRGDQELAAFLDDEIANEKKAHITFNEQMLDGFQVNYSEAEVTLTKKENDELIVIKSNVNNSVDADEDVMDPNSEKESQETQSQMKAKPEFTVEITKNKKTLSFHCSYTEFQPDGEDPGSESYNDSFQISEISIHVGEFKDSTYAVSGDIMDGYLYDLLMNYLEERGISNEFADKMVTFFTSYEHQLYINLLQGMKSFVGKK